MAETYIEDGISEEDRLYAFKISTSGMAGAADRWSSRSRSGLTDDELETALKYEIGEFGGRSGPDHMCVTYQRSGLRIWGSWHMMPIPSDNRVPLFKGASTMAMARRFYGVADPTDMQMELI